MGTSRLKLRFKQLLALTCLTVPFLLFQNFTYEDGLQELKNETLGNVEEEMWEKMKRRWLGSESIEFDRASSSAEIKKDEMKLVWSKANELQMRFDTETRVSCEVNPTDGMRMEFSKRLGVNTKLSLDHMSKEARSAIQIEHSW